jgi:hypothetical protein
MIKFPPQIDFATFTTTFPQASFWPERDDVRLIAAYQSGCCMQYNYMIHYQHTNVATNIYYACHNNQTNATASHANDK